MTAKEWIAKKWASTKSTGQTVAGVSRLAYRTGRGAIAATRGTFGLAGALMRSTFSFAPMALVAAGGLGYGILSTLSAPYSMTGPNVAYGYTPGATNAPMPQPTMEFGMKRTNLDPFASGTLSLALFNQRKA